MPISQSLEPGIPILTRNTVFRSSVTRGYAHERPKRLGAASPSRYRLPVPKGEPVASRYPRD